MRLAYLELGTSDHCSIVSGYGPLQTTLSSGSGMREGKPRWQAIRVGYIRRGGGFHEKVHHSFGGCSPLVLGIPCPADHCSIDRKGSSLARVEFRLKNMNHN